MRYLIKENTGFVPAIKLQGTDKFVTLDKTEIAGGTTDKASLATVQEVVRIHTELANKPLPIFAKVNQDPSGTSLLALPTSKELNDWYNGLNGVDGIHATDYKTGVAVVYNITTNPLPSDGYLLMETALKNEFALSIDNVFTVTSGASEAVIAKLDSLEKLVTDNTKEITKLKADQALFLKIDGTIDLASGYVPVNPKSIVSKDYVDVIDANLQQEDVALGTRLTRLEDAGFSSLYGGFQESRQPSTQIEYDILLLGGCYS